IPRRPYLVLVWMLVDLPGVTMVRIRHYSFLIDLMVSQCAINPMTSNIRSRTSLCAMSKMVIEPEVSNLAPAPNVDVISW
ncbi:hypothetical protein BS47DRAFT_1356649, partial [Hydnum rufescens UP504]